MANEGMHTTEYERAKSGGTWGIVALVFGLLMTMLAAIIPQVSGTSETAGIVAGMALSGLGVLQKGLTDLGYIKSRTEVKKANGK